MKNTDQKVDPKKYDANFERIFNHGRLTDEDCAEIAEILKKTRWRDPLKLCVHGNPAELNCEKCEPRPNEHDLAVYRAELADGLEREAAQMQICGEPGWANLARESAIQLRKESK